MIITVKYSQKSLENTILYIAKNNIYFLDKNDLIRESIMAGIESLIKDFPESEYCSTMGFTILVSAITIKSPIQENNSMELDFSVDPSLCDDGPLDWKEIQVHKK